MGFLQYDQGRRRATQIDPNIITEDAAHTRLETQLKMRLTAVRLSRVRFVGWRVPRNYNARPVLGLQIEK
jgi:hypothetical protein